MLKQAQIMWHSCRLELTRSGVQIFNMLKTPAAAMTTYEGALCYFRYDPFTFTECASRASTCRLEIGGGRVIHRESRLSPEVLLPEIRKDAAVFRKVAAEGPKSCCSRLVENRVIPRKMAAHNKYKNQIRFRYGIRNF